MMGADSSTAESPDTQPLADYLVHYGLSCDPFEGSSDGVGVDGFFPGAGRQELFDQLHHHCQFSSGLMAVLGEEGAGKTHLCHLLAEKFAEQDSAAGSNSLCLIDAPVHYSLEQILVDISLSFGLSGTGPIGQLLSEIRHYSHGPEQHEGLALVLIDNAHNLEDQTLGALISLLQGQENCRRRLQIVLFGQEELILRLDEYETGEVLIYDLNLSPLQLADVVEYLAVRMAIAGFSEDVSPSPFDATTIEQLWDQSQGNIKALNRLAHQWLVASVTPHNVSGSLGVPVGHIIAVALLASVLLLALFYRDDITLGESDLAVASASLSERATAAPTNTESARVTVSNKVAKTNVVEQPAGAEIQDQPEEPLATIHVTEPEYSSGLSNSASDVETSAPVVIAAESKSVKEPAIDTQGASTEGGGISLSHIGYWQDARG